MSVQVAGLHEILERAQLQEFLPQAQVFCNEMGAVHIEEIVSDPDFFSEFAEHLQLKRIPRKRLETVVGNLAAEPLLISDRPDHDQHGDNFGSQNAVLGASECEEVQGGYGHSEEVQGGYGGRGSGAWLSKSRRALRGRGRATQILQDDSKNEETHRGCSKGSSRGRGGFASTPSDFFDQALDVSGNDGAYRDQRVHKSTGDSESSSRGRGRGRHVDQQQRGFTSTPSHFFDQAVEVSGNDGACLDDRVHRSNAYSEDSSRGRGRGRHKDQQQRGPASTPSHFFDQAVEISGNDGAYLDDRVHRSNAYSEDSSRSRGRGRHRDQQDSGPASTPSHFFDQAVEVSGHHGGYADEGVHRSDSYREDTSRGRGRGRHKDQQQHGPASTPSHFFDEAIDDLENHKSNQTQMASATDRHGKASNRGNRRSSHQDQQLQSDQACQQAGQGDSARSRGRGRGRAHVQNVEQGQQQDCGRTTTAWLRVDPSSGAGLILVWSQGNGYIIDEIEAWPGQSGLHVGDVIRAISGIRLDTAATEEEAEELFSSVFVDGAQIDLTRGGNLLERLENSSIECRVDPEDGNSYTLQELQQKYAHQYSESTVRTYWRDECSAIPKSYYHSASSRTILQKTNPKLHANGFEIELSWLGLGTWAWGNEKWGYGSFDRNYSEAMIREVLPSAVDLGIHLVDTAFTYGRGFAENIIGQSGLTESSMVVATKYFPRPQHRDVKRAMLDAARQSQARLGKVGIGIFQLHTLHPTASLEEQADGLAAVVTAGLARTAGVCNLSLSEVRTVHARLASKRVPLATAQVEFSLLRQYPERSGFLAGCSELGVTVLAYSPLGMGRLTGKYGSRGCQPAWGEAGKGRPFGNAFGDASGQLSTLLQALREIGDMHGRTPAQVALNWIISRGAVPIPGAKNPAQARENAGALGWSLSMAEQERLASLGAEGGTSDFQHG